MPTVEKSNIQVILLDTVARRLMDILREVKASSEAFETMVHAFHVEQIGINAAPIV